MTEVSNMPHTREFYRLWDRLLRVYVMLMEMKTRDKAIENELMGIIDGFAAPTHFKTGASSLHAACGIADTKLTQDRAARAAKEREPTTGDSLWDCTVAAKRARMTGREPCDDCWRVAQCYKELHKDTRWSSEDREFYLLQAAARMKLREKDWKVNRTGGNFKDLIWASACGRLACVPVEMMSVEVGRALGWRYKGEAIKSGVCFCTKEGVAHD